MVSVTELNSFVKKFKYLWKSRIGAHLDLNTFAEQAWVGLHVLLGHEPGPPCHQEHQPRVKSRNGHSRQRRQERRAHEGKLLEASRAETENVDAENKTGSVETEKEADVSKATAEVVVEKLSELSSDAKTEVNFTCDLCDMKFNSLRAIRTHEGKKDKVTDSPIPQVNGTFDAEVVYTFVSNFHKEDIEYTLQEFLPEDVETKCVSLARIGGIQSADQLCTLSIKMPPDKNFTWPTMSTSQLEVIKDLKIVPNFPPA